VTPLTSPEPNKKPRIDGLDDPIIREVTPAQLTLCSTSHTTLALSTQVSQSYCS